MLPTLIVTLITVSGTIIYKGLFTIDFMVQFTEGFFNPTENSDLEQVYHFPTLKYSIIVDGNICYSWEDLFRKTNWRDRNTIELQLVFGNVIWRFDFNYGFDMFGGNKPYWGEDLFDLLKPYYESKMPAELIDVVIVERKFDDYRYPKKLVPSEWYDKKKKRYIFPDSSCL